MSAADHVRRACALPVRADLPSGRRGPSAEVYFSELAAAGDPRFIDKVAGAQFWLQTTPGQFQPLPMQKLADRLRAHVPTTGTLMVAGQLDYGVLAREGQTPFLLRHYSKAVAGVPGEVNGLRAKGTALEVVAHFAADHVLLTALLDGKPMPGTTFYTVDSDLSGEELKADGEGRAKFTPPSNDVYSIYIKHVDPTPGTHNGQKYQEVRQFATLAFSWPLVRDGADAEAVEMFTQALAARAAWKDFPGFAAKISGEVNERSFAGTVDVAGDGAVNLALEEDVVGDWVKDQLESITMHRAASQTPSSAAQAGAAVCRPAGRSSAGPAA